METTVDQRLKEITAMVSEQVGVAPAQLTPDSLLKEDHGADSLSLFEVLAAIEKKYDVVIDPVHLVRMVTVRGVYEVVAEAAGWS